MILQHMYLTIIKQNGGAGLMVRHPIKYPLRGKSLEKFTDTPQNKSQNKSQKIK